MFSMKKPAIILVLIVLLVFTGYLNHNLTKQALSKVSNDYQKHEEMELAEGIFLEDNNLVPTISEGDDKDDIEILDTRELKDIDEISKNAEEFIEETIVREDSLRSKNYFIEQRLSRDKLRAGLIDRLNEIVNNDNTIDEMRTEAQKKIMEIGEISEKELVVEGLIKAKGFEDVLIFLTKESAKVVVSIDELSEQDVVKILDVVITETNLEASNIKIMKKN
ncbi:SpoIIIAH-like family protein [Clostridium sp. Cult2]|uniref:SpoIIIAH-like family protein n=1 Tax=Clostridium sp. Cult2 TaxID=2079003 RepID=UPI001F3AF843|nr:SpoIIIAH-like family protein [Clostridium sp. Cult2]MCF6465616.1 stage III sporulation protein AH [Clostridium sp. Cult2]